MIELSFVLAFFSATLRMTTPIAFAAVGGMISERVGVMNIALEGMMILGTFSSAYFAHITGSPWFGVLAAILVGLASGFLHAILCITFRANHIISSFGINLFAIGSSPFFSAVVWGSRGSSENVPGIPPLSSLGLRGVAILDALFGAQSPLFIILLTAVILLHIILFKTSLGLRIRAIGANPKVAAVSGIKIRKIQFMCVTISGALASLGGAYLVLSVAAHYSTGMTAGRGFIGLVAMIMGKWKPLNIFATSMLIGFGDALQISFQSSGIPVQMIQMIPYILTLMILLGLGRISPPTAYKPYIDS